MFQRSEGTAATRLKDYGRGQEEHDDFLALTFHSAKLDARRMISKALNGSNKWGKGCFEISMSFVPNQRLALKTD